MELDKISIKQFKGKYETKWFVNTDSLTSWEEVEKTYKKLFQHFQNEGITIIYEKTFGDIKDLEKLNETRDKALEATAVSNYQITYMEGSPLQGDVISGITFFGLSNMKETEIIYENKEGTNTPIATLIENPSEKRLYVQSVSTNEFKSDIYAETKKVFEEIDQLAIKHGFNSKDLVRTWIYLDEIYDNYEAFNLSRKEFFDLKEIPYSFDCNDLPASTCIEGRKAEDVNVVVDALYINKEDAQVEVTRMFNPLQNEAEGDTYEFQPTFSRGISLEGSNYCEVQISGTASINHEGKTIYLDDSYGQIKQTLLNVKSLLGEKGLGMDDIVQMTCFFKNKEYHEQFIEVVKELRMPTFGRTFVQGKVCRENLLFELDGIAFKNK